MLASFFPTCTAYRINILSSQSLWITCKTAEQDQGNWWKGLTITSSGSIGPTPWMAFLSIRPFFIYLAQETTIARFYLQEWSQDRGALSIRWFQELATYRNVEVEDCMSSCVGAYMYGGTVIWPRIWMLKAPCQNAVIKQNKTKNQCWHLWALDTINCDIKPHVE